MTDRYDIFDEEVRKFREQLLSEFKERVEKVKASLETASAATDKLHKRSKQGAILELEMMRTQTVRAIRAVMSVQSKTGEELFAQAGGTSTLQCGQFAAFLKSIIGVV